MDKYLTTDEFIAIVTNAMRATLERDFGTDRKSHVVDLMTHATTGMEWMYQFVDAYGGVDADRRTKIEDIKPVVKSGKRTK